MRVRVGAIVPVTEAEGPGARFALWVQGCSIRCRDCCNPLLFDPGRGTEVEVAALVEQVREVCHSIEGVTLLGGEPFDQPAPLAAFARGARGLGLSVMTFTGYRIEELAGPSQRELVAATDLLVDGRYEAELPELDRRWVGSTNQRFHFLTGRYAPGIERCPRRDVEVRLGPDGRMSINGWPALLRFGRAP